MNFDGYIELFSNEILTTLCESTSDFTMLMAIQDTLSAIADSHEYRHKITRSILELKLEELLKKPKEQHEQT